uniref:Uncharacterized protein n=1 Tax=Mola mola TaxID=94237 RepID=A0A3Q3X2Y7_MOLML
MATSLLRLGRLGFLKCVRADSRVVLTSRPARSFCCQAEEPPKMPKKKQTASEKAAAAPPEPPEPFDNSTYKNYQHHSYDPYTFADLDVDMAKYRLPQPSSGRH